MTQIAPVNLDELATPTKSIILDKVTHNMRELTVQEFIDRAREAEKVKDQPGEDAEGWSMDRKVEKLVELVHDAFPTVSKERLGKLHFAQLNAVLDLTLKTPEQLAADIKTAGATAPEGNA